MPVSERQKLLARQAKLTQEWEALHAQATDPDGEGWTAEMKAKDDAYVAEAEEIKDALERIDRRTSATAAVAAADGARIPEAVAGSVDVATGRIEGVREEAPFATQSDFLAAVMSYYSPSDTPVATQEALQRYQAAATGGSQTVPADGGFLVNPEYSNSIWDGMAQSPDNLLGMTDQYTITGESLTMKANAETSRVTGLRYGAMQGYWIKEADQITSSKPKSREMKLEPQELAVLVYLTDKQIRNTGPSLAQYVQRAATQEIMFLVGDAIINGNGTGKPKGLLNSGCKVTQAAESGQGAGTIIGTNISKMWSRLHPRARANAVWLYNVEIEPQLDKLSLTGSGSNTDYMMYLPPGGLRDNPNPLLKGRPMIPHESCAALGTEGDLILTDLSGYATGVKGSGVRSDVSMHLRFDYAETAFRFMFEVDGQCWLASALTPFKGSNTLSTVVTLNSTRT